MIKRSASGSRRTLRRRTNFPLTDSDGVRVQCERRTCPDRRLSCIQFEWLESLTPEYGSGRT